MPTNLLRKVVRKTTTPASTYGKDASRDLIVSLIPSGAGDLIELRPLRCKNRALSCTVKDLWSYLLRCQAGQAWSVKMAAKKAAKAAKQATAAQRKETRRLARAVVKELVS